MWEFFVGGRRLSVPREAVARVHRDPLFRRPPNQEVLKGFAFALGRDLAICWKVVLNIVSIA